LESLKILEDFFECGHIFVNRRYDNHTENLYRFCVRSLSDLREKIIPFFSKNQLKTSKKEVFKKFVKVLGMMEANKHLNLKGITEIAHIAKTINRCKTPKFLKSSETIRQPMN